MSPKLKNIAIPILLSFLLLPVSAIAETAKLEMKILEDAAWDPEADDFLLKLTSSSTVAYHNQGNAENQWAKEFGDLVAKEPEYSVKEPLKGIFTAGASKFPVVLDSSDMAENGFDRLIIDLNKNRDLTDDEIIEAIPPRSNYSGSYRRNEFPVITAKIKADDEEYDYAFLITVTSNLDNKEQLAHASATAKSMAYRAGSIKIGDTEKKVYIVDFNSNGLYNDATTLSPHTPSPSQKDLMVSSGDAVFVDPDLENKDMDGYELVTRPERQYVSDVINVDGKYYEVELTPSGSVISVTESDIPTGSITSDNKDYALVILNEENDRTLKLFGKKGEEISVPEGKWLLRSYYVDASKSDDVKKKTFVTATGTYDFEPVEVKAGETVAFPFAEKFVPSVIAYPYGDNRASLQLQINDEAGAKCTGITVEGQRPEAPKFVISTGGGKVIERGSFEYG